MTPLALLSAARGFAAAALSFLGTWPGALLIGAFVGGWFWGGHVESAWRAKEAASRAAVAEQVAQWESAAKEIAQAATNREAERAAAAKAQAVFTAQHVEGESHAKSSGRSALFLDPDYAGLVLAFDAAARGAQTPDAAAKLRAARPVARSDRCAAVKIFALRNREAASEANRRLANDAAFYEDVRRGMGAEDGAANE